ncbi:metal-sensitive transcriptional regulator [Clostridium estertheticum]|uniref:metal-sensitive transcriptional regulator n=1 Tax=Clostridium estertheticum TaxID=238834 RepID=UPI001C0B8D38|nr:metal-sensitive transcriptional regulator [Clostridium estertheticum]MBU3175085.1 metal-sensitive transcriptional regulator [Clostridium estertheticum]MBU3198870.1 metal-sensitive transcriptional regulator [Clostridium estertheticum]MBX4259897.1 metal-sensitive transcriptional regulator [Clostridium estertheticum]MCB2358899.1 metal-sensitive transcriptional regulator [Clostridium estertheticum]WAG64181.1 metal-sensitive transcriptional regulator [Clostridium estertheticum]
MINDDDKSINDELVKNIQVRLRKIEGQVKGIEKMITCEACCKDVLVQVAAARAAMNKVGGLVLERYTKNCLLHEDNGSDEEKNEEKAKIEELVSTFLMFLK